MNGRIKDLFCFLRPFLFIFIPCLLLQCAVRQWPVYKKDGERFGVIEGSFRGKWWNYYERGLSYLSGGFYKEALTDFSEAIKRNPFDTCNAQTYGTNFIDYFPHRELGIAYYRTGDLKHAEEELELSLSQFPTAKASHYLDCVRKDLIDKHSGEIPPPVITLGFKEEEVFTRDDPVVISGDVVDENYIADLKVNGKPVPLQGSKKQVYFEQSLDLLQGRHVIDIEAVNLAGKISKARMILIVDREGPVINIDDLTMTKGDNSKGVFIRGIIEDPARVSMVYINGKSIVIEEGRQVEINRALTISMATARISIVAVDSLGNPSTLHIPLSGSSSSLAPVRLASADPVMAYSGMVVDSVMDYPMVTDSVIAYPVMADPVMAYSGMVVDSVMDYPMVTDSVMAYSRMADSGIAADPRMADPVMAYPRMADTVMDYSGVIDPVMADSRIGLGISLPNSESPDREPSVQVGFNDNIPDNLKVYQDKIYIKGQAASDCTITKILINGEPERYKCSRMIAFSKLIPLEKGENIIIVEAVDEEGNMGEARRVIWAEAPQAFDWTERIVLSIPKFKHFKNNKLVTGIDDTTRDDFQTYLRKALFEQERFFIRDENAQYYIDGKIKETGKSIEIFGEIKNTENDELLVSVDVFKEAKNIRELAYEMAYLILLEFPMIKGEVTLCTDNHIFTDVYHKKLKLKTNLIVYREELLMGEDPEGTESVPQEVIIDSKVLGRARLEAKLDETKRTKAVLIRFKPGAVRVSDKVVTE